MKRLIEEEPQPRINVIIKTTRIISRLLTGHANRVTLRLFSYDGRILPEKKISLNRM